MIGLPRFLERSQINELLRRTENENVELLKFAHHQLFRKDAACLSVTGDIVVDQSGFIANGKNYELTSKGYFCKKKNQKEYQLITVFYGDENSETISLFTWILRSQV